MASVSDEHERLDTHSGTTVAVTVTACNITAENVSATDGAQINIGHRIIVNPKREDIDYKQLCDQTEDLIQQLCPQGFVKTSVFNKAISHLDSKGVCVILGRAGDGKTELGLQILKHYQKLEKKMPVELTSPGDWKCVKTREDVIIFLDDPFHKCKSDWMEILKHCTPNPRKVKYVITSQPHLYNPERDGMFRNNRLLKRAPTVQSYHLNSTDKEEILRRFMEYDVTLTSEPAQKLTDDEISTAVKLSLDLGFPQCCQRFFEYRREGRKISLDFFGDPLKYDEAFLTQMAEEEPKHFQVLVLAMLQGGTLHANAMTDDQIKFAKEFGNESDVTTYHIGRIAKQLRDKYFKNEESQREEKNKHEEFSFLHRSMYELVFRYVLPKYEEKTVRLSPFDLVEKFVCTEDSQTLQSDEEMYKVKKEILYDRLTAEIQAGNVTALSHPSLRNEEIENEYAKHFCKVESNVSKLLKFEVPDDSKSYLDAYLDQYEIKPKKENDPLSFEHMTGGYKLVNITSSRDCLCQIAYMGLTKFVKVIVDAAYSGPVQEKVRQKLTEILPFACAAGDRYLCEVLRRKGAHVLVETIQAACSCRVDDESMLKMMLEKFKLEKANPEKISECCYIAVQQGNAAMLEQLLMKCSKKLSAELPSLYDYYLLQCHGKYVDHSNDDADRDERMMKVSEVLRKYSREQLVHPTRDLFLAAGHKTRSLAVKLIKDRADPKCQHSEEKYTPLHVAVTYGGQDVVEALLEKGASLNIPDVEGKTPLHWLGNEIRKQILFGSQSRLKDLLSIMEFLLNHGRTGSNLEVDCAQEPLDNNSTHLLSRPDEIGRTPLHYIFGEVEEDDVCSTLLHKKAVEPQESAAISSALCKVVELLKKKNVSPSITDERNFSIMHSYVSTPYCHQRVLESMLDFGHSVNCPDLEEKTPFHIYMSAGVVSPEVVDFFLRNGASLNGKDKDQTTPWMQYFRRVDAKPELVRRLLQKGADLTLADCRKWTALHFYCSSENAAPDLLEEMIAARSHVEKEDKLGRTALMILCDAGNIPKDVVTSLINAGCSVNASDQEGRTALFYLCSNPIGFEMDVLKVLLDNGADPTKLDQLNRSPLHVYVSQQPKVRTKVIKLLLDHKADANVVDANGSTALHLLLTSGCATVKNATALLDAVHLTDLQDKNGSTPLHLACSYQPKLDVIKKILARILTPEKVDKNEQTALHVYHSGWWPVEKAVVQCLLEGGNKDFVNMKDNMGRTALQLYCQTARQVHLDIDQDVVICHMKHGFDPSSTDADGAPPLQCSVC